MYASRARGRRPGADCEPNRSAAVPGGDKRDDRSVIVAGLRACFTLSVSMSEGLQPRLTTSSILCC